jgi:hypothetical protein
MLPEFPKNTALRTFPVFDRNLPESHVKRHFHTAQETPAVPVTDPSQLMLYREIKCIYSHDHNNHTNIMCGRTAAFWGVNPDGLN